MFKSSMSAILVLTMLFTGCQKEDPEQVYKNAMNEQDPARRIQAVQRFVDDYPEHENLARAYSRLFRDHLELGQTEAALDAAGRYLNSYPEDARILNYNFVAWMLADKGVALDSAKVYAEKAVALAKKNQIRQLPMIRDTYAYILYLLQDYQTAEAVQREAVTGNEQNGPFLYHYGLILYANGKTEQAMHTMARAILNAAGEEAGTALRTWLDAIGPEAERKKTAGEVAGAAVKEFLAAEDSRMRRSWCALLYATAGVHPDEAEKWALEAAADTGETDPDIRMAAHKILAYVYRMLGKDSDMVAALERVRDEAMPYDLAYWLELGGAYRTAGRPEEALDAFVTGLSYEKSDQLLQAARALEPDDAILEDRIEAKTASLTDFDPGKFDPETVSTRRVVLVELFTGSECPPCLGADEALDKIAEYYPRDAVALLEYHLHIPRPDPMTNTSAEERYAYYGRNFGTPTVYINGTDKLVGGGPEIVKRNLFNNYRKRIDAVLEKPVAVHLECRADLSGDKVRITVNADAAAGAPGNAVLYTALVERHVEYAGGNGVTRHLFVVRKVLGGGEPVLLNPGNGSGSITREIDLTAVETELKQYLDDFTQAPPERHRTFKGWQSRPEKLDRNNLAVIAWLQDTESNKVIQAVYSGL